MLSWSLLAQEWMHFNAKYQNQARSKNAATVLCWIFFVRLVPVLPSSNVSSSQQSHFYDVGAVHNIFPPKSAINGPNGPRPAKSCPSGQTIKPKQWRGSFVRAFSFCRKDLLTFASIKVTRQLFFASLPRPPSQPELPKQPASSLCRNSMSR